MKVDMESMYRGRERDAEQEESFELRQEEGIREFRREHPGEDEDVEERRVVMVASVDEGRGAGEVRRQQAGSVAIQRKGGVKLSPIRTASSLSS